MGSGQMMLTLFGMVLLSLVMTRVNNNLLNTTRVLTDTKSTVLAISLATSILEEANGKAFDAKTDTSSLDVVTNLTAPTSLGPETGEVYATFNDFDDYNNLAKVDTSMPTATFKINCKVQYVASTAPDVPVSVRTWHKRMTVKVSSPSMIDTVTFAQVYSYWYFR